MSLKQLKQYEMVTSTMKTVTRSVSVAGFIHTFTIDEIRGRVQCASTVPVSSDASLTAWIGREFDILEAPVSAAIAIPASNNLAIVATENADLALVRQTGGSTLVKARSLHAHLSATAWIVSLALSQTLASTCQTKRIRCGPGKFIRTDAIQSLPGRATRRDGRRRHVRRVVACHNKASCNTLILCNEACQNCARGFLCSVWVSGFGRCNEATHIWIV
ncbi:hypothetical protein BC830DRAFT_920808 [Chytriomyces sp. MP71]|nr:hypothetical protein BC830DRAFT_920808 [Chytriomyces sp. MP71]